jgi:hypothetical protein
LLGDLGMSPEWNWSTGERCADCGESLWEDLHRAFVYRPRSYVCWDCGLDRGGVFDSELGQWTSAPDVDDLATRSSRLLSPELVAQALGPASTAAP